MEACELLSVELRLDRIEAELATELPAHLRAFARAAVHGDPPPPAPDVLHRPLTLATARAAVVHAELADRGLALLRLAAPLAIEADPAVAAARAMEATWEALSALAAARDAAAAARFGRRAIDVMHRLHGSAVDLSGISVGGASVAGSADREGEVVGLPPAVAGWFAADGAALDDRAIAAAWGAIAARHGVDGVPRIERSATGHSATFLVEPGREVVVVIPARVAAPAERFAVLHEFGHALVAFALPCGVPRVVDEAAGAYIARAIERDTDPWYSPLAVAARARRGMLARALDRIERALPQPQAPPRVSDRPPWALWHDPGAQAAYAAAERLTDAIERAIGASPLPGAFPAALAAWSEPIDRLASGVHAV
jgi:hypothetical protein